MCKMSSLFSFQFAFRIRAFAIVQACVFPRRSIDRDRRTRRLPRIPRNFSPFLYPGPRVRLVFLTFVSRLTYECPVVTARPIVSAAARELHENRAEKVSPVYVNVTGQHPPGVRGSTTSERERERERDMRTSGQRAAPSVRNNRCSSRRE